MDVYEFYWRDPIKGYQLIGALPERRKNPERINNESLVNLAKELLGNNVNVNEVFYIKVIKDENTGKIHRSNSVYRALKEYFKERRQYPRVYIDLSMEYSSKYDRHARGGIVIDGSETGFLIHSAEDISIGTTLKIVILFPSGYKLATVEVFAEVVWKKFVAEQERKDRYQYGLKIVKISEEEHRKLKKLLIGEGF